MLKHDFADPVLDYYERSSEQLWLLSYFRFKALHVFLQLLKYIKYFNSLCLESLRNTVIKTHIIHILFLFINFFHDGPTNNPTYKCDQRTIDYSSKAHRQRTCISNAQKESQRRRIGKLWNQILHLSASSLFYHIYNVITSQIIISTIISEITCV